MNFQNFGINEDTRTVQNVPFPVETYFKEFKAGKRKDPFCIAILTEVSVSEGLQKKYKLLDGVELADGEEPTIDQVQEEGRKVSLNFVFTSLDGQYQYIEYVNAVKHGSDKFQNNARMRNERIAHIFDVYAPGKAPQFLALNKLEEAAGKEFSKSETASDFYRAYFKEIAKVFNTAKNGEAIYTDVNVRIKLVRSDFGKNPNRLQMPLGNVIERASNETSILTRQGDEKYELIEVAGATNAPSPMGTPGKAPTPPADGGWPDDIG